MAAIQTSRKPVPSACSTCKRRKRRCDRVFPKCSSCIWLEQECHYNELPYSISPQGVRITTCQLNVSENFVSQFLSLGPEDPKKVSTCSSTLSSFTSLEIPACVQLGYLHVSRIIIEEASKIFGSLENLNAMVAKYFASVHLWIPMLSKRRFYERLSAVWSQNGHDFIMLICCMHLITHIPLNSELEHTASSLYNMVRRLFALVDSMGIVSVELVQSKLLIALFEMAHGLQSAAYMSIGACSRMGVLLGINKLTRQRALESDNDWVQREEESRTWWAIIITDRFISLQNLECPSAAKDPNPKDYLPLDDEEWDQERSGISMPVPTPSHVRVGAFARQAQVSNLLGRVLRNKCEPTSDEVFNTKEALQLERTLDAYSVLLPQEASATACGNYCSPIGICNSAQLMLHQSDSQSKQELTKYGHCPISPMLETLSKNIVDIANGFDIQRNSIDMEGLTPFMPHCVYQASIVQAQLVQERNDLSSIQGLQSLQRMLIRYEERWRIAGKYLANMKSLSSTFSLSN